MDFKQTEGKEAREEKIVKPAIILRFKKSKFIKDFVCAVCPCSYTKLPHLIYHTRRNHYNLLAKISKREHRKINEVWLERVLNSNDVIEIKKTGHNKYLMKKSSNPDGVDIVESTETIDLMPLYPDCARWRTRKIYCSLCQKTFLAGEYGGHLKEDHAGIADLIV